VLCDVFNAYVDRGRFAEKEGSAVATMTMVREMGDAEVSPIPPFGPRNARGWAVPAVVALHWAALASLAVASIGAGLTLWLG
jgi:hypothetical protein